MPRTLTDSFASEWNQTMVAPGDHPPRESMSPGDVVPYLTFPGAFAYPEQDAAAHDGSAAVGLGLPELLHSLRRQWLLGALIGLCFAAVAAAGMWFTQKPKHTSIAFLRISARDAPLIFETADRSGRPDFKTYLATQQQLMLTPLVLNAALRSDELTSLPRVKALIDPIEWLQKGLTVDFKAEIGQVSFTDPDANVAKAAVDGVISAYMEEVVLAEETVRRQRLDNLERVYAEAETKIRTKRADMKSLVDSLGSGDSESLSLAQQGAIQEFGLYRNELTRVQFELMRAEGEQKLRSAAAERPDADPKASTSGDSGVDDIAARPVSIEIAQAIKADPTASALGQDIAHLRTNLAQVKRRFTAAAAADRVKEYEQEIADLEQQLVQRCREIESEFAAQPLALVGNGNVSSNHDHAFQIAVLKGQEKELLEEVARRESEARKFGRSSIDVEMMRAEITSLDGVLARIGEEIERTKVELRSGTRTAVISPASVPQTEDLKRRAAMTAVGGLGGFGIPIALLVFLDVRRRRVDGVATITDRLRLDVLGVVPRIPSRAMRRIGNESPKSTRWQERLIESINAVTAMLLRKAALEDKRVILVSSAVAGEGKTTLAGQLGIRLAETGHRTLLIDFDLRRPALHVAFDCSQDPGVAELLCGTAKLSEAVQPTEHVDLSLIAAGSGVLNLLNSTTQGAIDELFQSVRPDYDFVIVDCSPVLPVVDTRLIGRFADGIILSVIKDVSEAPKVAAARTILQSHGVAFIGTVVTGESQEVYVGRRQSTLVAT